MLSRPKFAARREKDTQRTALDWTKTGLELAATVVGIVAVVWAFAGNVPGELGGVILIPFLLLGLLTLGVIPKVIEHYREKHFISLFSVFFGFLAHGGLAYALICEPGYRRSLLLLVAWRPLLPWQFLPIFCAAMLSVRLIELYLLVTSDYRISKYQHSVRFRLILSSVIGYAILLLLSLLILTVYPM